MTSSVDMAPGDVKKFIMFGEPVERPGNFTVYIFRKKEDGSNVVEQEASCTGAINTNFIICHGPDNALSIRAEELK